MEHIQRVSRYVLNSLWLFIFLILLTTILTWCFIGESIVKSIWLFSGEIGHFADIIKTPNGVVNLSDVQWSTLSKLIGFMASVLGQLTLYFGVLRLKEIFKNYAAGQVFTTINARHYKFLAWLFFLQALVFKSLSDGLMVVAVTFCNPPGERFLTINYGTPNIESLFCGAIFIVISWVMVEACKIHDEQNLTI